MGLLRRRDHACGELGRKLARGETKDISGEGIHTLSMVRKYRLFDSAPYRLYGLIDAVVRDPRDVAQRFRDLIESTEGV